MGEASAASLVPAESPVEPEKVWPWPWRVFLQADLNFLLTNRLPRQTLTRFMGWFSKLRIWPIPWVSIAVWRSFARDLDLGEAETQRFASMHDCFVRRLQPGARPVDPRPGIMVSPADAILGACGTVQRGQVLQCKGAPYQLIDLLGDARLVRAHEGSRYLTLRLKSSFYHRFHAPCEGRLERVIYIAGDCWNVNSVALQRVAQLFCKNERLVLDLQLDEPGIRLTLVPVAAILVASMRLHCLPERLHLRYRGPNQLPVSAAFARGEELGYFEHGSTILIFVSPEYELCPGLGEGSKIRVGEALLRRAAPQTTPTPSPGAAAPQQEETDV